jgi:2-polyprenyl-6-methoxyphenol hydroxylase-like FAD-dependent oxidoreductase
MTRPGGDALVIGAGTAGLAATIALRRAGWSVELVERAPELRAVGAALSLWPNAVEGLRRLDAAGRIEGQAAPIRRMLLATRTRGGSWARLIDRAVVGDAFLVPRALLQDALLDAIGDVPIAFGVEAVGLVSAERGEVGFADGSRRSADLVVVADGLRSPVARAVIGTEPAHAGYAGVVAMSDPVAEDGVGGLAAEYWGRHERFGVCDLGAGRRYWFHMRTAAAGAPALSHHQIASRAEAWPASVRAAVAATPPDRLIPWPIHAKPPPRRLGKGRVVCVGDAGHAMEPNLGQGACQAIEDAVALAAAVARGGAEEVPGLFETMRLKRARAVVRRSAEGGRAVHGPGVVQGIMRAGLKVVPNTIQERMVAGMQTLPPY